MISQFRRRLLGTGALIGIGMCAVAGGLVAKNVPPAGAPQAGGLEDGPRSFTTDRNLGEHNPHWNNFIETHPGAWRSRWDSRTGFPNLIYGEGIDTTRRDLDETALSEIAFDVVAEHGALFGLSGFDLQGEPAHARNTWYLNLSLVHDGIPFEEHTRFGIRVKDNGVIAAIKNDGVPKELESNLAGVNGQVAVDSVLSSLSLDLSELHVSDPELWYVTDDTATGRLTWRFQIRNGDLADPFGKEYFVHASSDLTVYRINELIHYDHSGSVSANLIVGETNDPPVVTLLSDARVTITAGGSGSELTDAVGDFNFAGGSGSRTIRSRMNGRWVNVNNDVGSDIETSITADEGDNFHFSLNGTPDELTTAETTAFYWTTLVHDFSSSIMGNNGLEFELDCNVNITSTCNAYWDGVAINFFQSGGGCPNTAHDATIIAHEYGHGIDSRQGGILSGALSEGFGDALAMIVTDQPCAGIDFNGPGTCLRSGDEVLHYPAPECNGESHCIGKTVAQFTRVMTNNLKASLGDGPGLAKAADLILIPMLANPNSIPDYVLEVFIADDDDGNLINGTPDFDDIATAADSRSIPRPEDPTLIDVVHLQLTNTTDVVNERQVLATVESIAGSITGVELNYRIGQAGPYTAVAMTATANADEYEGAIPPQPCPSVVEYFISATDDAGNDETLPRNAPNDGAFNYLVAKVTIFFFDDMESGENGWTHQEIATQDDWMLGEPNQQGDNPYDPISAWSGSSVWGNDLNPPGYQGNYINNVHNVLTSPSIDLSSAEGSTLKYRRWLSVEKGIFDQATLEVGGTAIWQNDDNVDHLDTSWVEHEIDISAIVDGDPDVQIAYRLQSDGFVVFGGWNIDDVEISSADCDIVTLTVDDDTPSIGESVSFTTISGPKTAYDLYSANELGSESVQAPGGGPLVETLLGPSIRLRRSDATDGAGVDVFTRNVPNRVNLIGRVFHVQDVGENETFQASNLIDLVIQP